MPMTDELHDVLATVFRRLAEGANSPASAWRHAALGTVDAGGQPAVRTVVLRHFDAAALTADVHTDARSAKAAALRLQPQAALHWWNPAASEQIRLEGRMAMHHGDAVAHAAWAALRPASADTYRVHAGPGCVIRDPADVRPGLDDAAAFDVFLLLRLHIEKIEWLLIGNSGHRRARLTWENGAPAAMWLVP